MAGITGGIITLNLADVPKDLPVCAPRPSPPHLTVELHASGISPRSDTSRFAGSFSVHATFEGTQWLRPATVVAPLEEAPIAVLSHLGSQPRLVLMIRPLRCLHVPQSRLVRSGAEDVSMTRPFRMTQMRLDGRRVGRVRAVHVALAVRQLARLFPDQVRASSRSHRLPPSPLPPHTPHAGGQCNLDEASRSFKWPSGTRA